MCAQCVCFCAGKALVFPTVFLCCVFLCVVPSLVHAVPLGFFSLFFAFLENILSFFGNRPLLAFLIVLFFVCEERDGEKAVVQLQWMRVKA